MKKIIRSQSGAGLIEIIIAAAIGGIVIAGFANQYLIGKEMTTYISKNESLDQIFRYVMIEIENQAPGSRPPLGTCRVRKYSRDGVVLSESDSAGTDCKDVPASASSFVLAWQVKSQGSIGVAFSDPNFMKLPTVVPTVLPIEVFGKFSDHRTGKAKTKKYVIYGEAQ